MKIVALIAVFMLSIGGSAAIGQYSAVVNTAETVIKGESQALAYFGIYDDVNALVGAYRYGIGGYTDASVRFGFVDYNRRFSNDDGFVLAGDLRYQVMEVRIKDPLDLAVGGSFETVLGIGAGNFSFGGFVTGSHSIALNKDKNLWPFGRLIMRLDRFASNTDFNIGLNIGASFNISQSTFVSSELQFDNQFGFIIGIIFGL